MDAFPSAAHQASSRTSAMLARYSLAHAGVSWRCLVASFIPSQLVLDDDPSDLLHLVPLRLRAVGLEVQGGLSARRGENMVSAPVRSSKPSAVSMLRRVPKGMLASAAPENVNSGPGRHSARSSVAARYWGGKHLANPT